MTGQRRVASSRVVPGTELSTELSIRARSCLSQFLLTGIAGDTVRMDSTPGARRTLQWAILILESPGWHELAPRPC